MMDISYLKDPRLSWAAKGLYTWLLTQEQGISVDAARAVCPNEEELVAALEELQNLGIMQIDNPLAALGGGKGEHAA